MKRPDQCKGVNKYPVAETLLLAARLHRWKGAPAPVTLLILLHHFHFPSSVLVLDLWTFHSQWYCNLPVHIFKRNVLSKALREIIQLPIGHLAAILVHPS